MTTLPFLSALISQDEFLVTRYIVAPIFAPHFINVLKKIMIPFSPTQLSQFKTEFVKQMSLTPAQIQHAEQQFGF